MKTTVFFCIFCLFLITNSLGQQGKMFTVDKELSSSMINKLFQDKDGLIWIATEDGLNCYDGAKFTAFQNDKNNNESIISSYTRSIFEDSKGKLYIGTLTGLVIYDVSTGKFKKIRTATNNGELTTANISSVIELRNKDILIGTSGHGVFVIKSGENDSIAYRDKDLIPSLLINALFEDRQERLWVATESDGLLRIDSAGVVRNYFTEKEMVWNVISSFCEDGRGNFFVGNMGRGLFKYNEDKDIFEPITYKPNPNLPVKTLYMMNQDEIYIGTDGYGLKIYDTRLKSINESDINISDFDFNKSKIHSIIKDKSGNIWMGFFQKGVMLIPASVNAFKYLGHKGNKPSPIGYNCVMSVIKDKTGTLWVGTDNDGIYGIDEKGNQIAHYLHTTDTNSVPATIMTMIEDSNNNIWLGSYLNGIAKFDPKTGKCKYVKLNDSKNNQIQRFYSFAEDNNKNIWIGTMGAGIHSINIQTGKTKRMPNIDDVNTYDWMGELLYNTWVNCILHTSDEKLYIGTYDGMACLDLKKMSFVSTYNRNKLLDGKVIYTLHEDKHKNIWAGTTEGLICWKPKTSTFSEYTTADGLPSNVICAIKSDDDDNLWISTTKGLSRFNIKNKTFVNYYSSDGLQGNEFSKNAAFMDKNGEMFFGGTSGITYFKPQEIHNPTKKPDIFISDFYINDKTVRKGMKSTDRNIINSAVMYADTFYLSHKDNSISIEFSVKNFSNPERMIYMYTTNNKWITLNAGANRVTFSNLKPGTYNFKVKAKDYTTLSDERKITIIISPAWYASTKAIVGYVILLSIIAYIVFLQIRHRYSLRQQVIEHMHAEQINEAKLNFFINISHEIRTPMSLVISPLQKLIAFDKDSERQKTYFTIYRNANRILRLINQLMDIRKIDKGQMVLKFQETNIICFIKNILKTFEYQAYAKKIELSFESQKDEIFVWIDPINFDKIIINIISNALKFTPENGKISISAETVNAPNDTSSMQNHLKIVVRDNGIGIQESEKTHIFERFYQINNSTNKVNTGTGIGLHLAHTLTELHHGTISVSNNTNDKGCHFTVCIPLGKKHLQTNEIEDNPANIEKNEPEYFADIITDVYETENKKNKSKTKRHILIVEDDEEIRNYLRKELTTDFYIHECKNGKEGLESVLKKAPDLIICDVMMPEMDGLTFCRKIKQNITINHIPIILLTAKSEVEDNLQGLSNGADAYIMKPFSMEILRKTIENIIKSRDMLKNCYSGKQEQEKKLEKIQIQSPDDKLLERVMKVINDNISNQALNVEMITNEVGISRVHLHRKMKELTNQSTRDLIRNTRIKQAAMLLTEKRHNISEIALQTGFSNATYFSTAFKELYGVSPSEYMESHQNKTE